MGNERIIGLDRHAPVDVVLEVPVRGMRLREERVDAGMTGVPELEQVARLHGIPSGPHSTAAIRPSEEHPREAVSALPRSAAARRADAPGPPLRAAGAPTRPAWVSAPPRP